ncbi:hypothetical protein QOT17_022927 [Balamuthia mandrillaris]
MSATQVTCQGALGCCTAHLDGLHLLENSNIDVGKITNTYLKTPHVGSVPDSQLSFLLYSLSLSFLYSLEYTSCLVIDFFLPKPQLLSTQLHKAQQEYLCMFQQSFQLVLFFFFGNTFSLRTAGDVKLKLDEVVEHTRKAMEQLQQHMDNFVVFLASTSAILGNYFTCNTTAATASPPSSVPQISPI